MKLAVTGAEGLLGWHFCCAARARSKDYELRRGTRETFSSAEKLAEFISGADVVVHFAGMNRGADDEIEEVNPKLAKMLVDACDATGTRPQFVYSSSIHQSRDNPYGRSKRRAGEILASWADQAGTAAAILVLPHVFGEGGRPFYNSVVSTFCHQIANDEPTAVKNDAELELLHAQDVAARILDQVADVPNGDQRATGRKITVRALLSKLTSFGSSYGGHLVPSLDDALDRDLFNTYRQYLYPSRYPVSLALREDDRGSLVEAVKSSSGGQVFFSTTVPGITRGNHYHLRKVERFLVLNGEATIRIRKVFSNEIVEYRVSGSAPQYVDIPTLHTHNITNVGSGELLTLFWANEIFDPGAPDTTFEPVDAPP